MKFRATLVGLCALALATAATAQTKISGTQQCKAEPPAPVGIPDRPGHAFAIIKTQCTWSKPVEMAGAQADGTMTYQIDGEYSAP